jgi:hypothetical protein
MAHTSRYTRCRIKTTRSLFRPLTHARARALSLSLSSPPTSLYFPSLPPSLSLSLPLSLYLSLSLRPALLRLHSVLLDFVFQALRFLCLALPFVQIAVVPPLTSNHLPSLYCLAFVTLQL